MPNPGKNIRESRIDHGLTQDELARLVGYSDRTMIAKIEAGKVDLPLSKVEAFAKILHVSICWLISWNCEGDHKLKETP
jgi:repressor LexA